MGSRRGRGERGQALVIVSFGTSVPEARAAITAVEETLEQAAPGYLCRRAFTSPTIRRILAGRGEEVPSLAQALDSLREAGVERVAVQPTHLLYGYEYDKLKAEAEAAALPELALGRPLLAGTEDIRRFARRLSAAYPPEAGRAVVLMGHGTEHFANAVYPALQTALRLEGREDVLVGTVEGWPGLEDILRQLEPGGPRHLRLVPLMLVAGDHARADMAEEWKPRLEQAGHTASCVFTGLGELPWVQEMYRERLLQLLHMEQAVD